MSRDNNCLKFSKPCNGQALIPALITALKDDYKWVRMRAAEALGQFGPLSIEAVPTLIGALEDVDADVIYNARDALKRIQS
jgi:HEAT repeat protein